MPNRVVVDDVVPQMSHYPPLSTLKLYDSEPLIDLDGLLFRYLVASCLHHRANIRVDRLCTATAILSLSLSLPMQQVHDQHRASVRRYLIPGSSFFMYNLEQQYGNTDTSSVSVSLFQRAISPSQSDRFASCTVDSRYQVFDHRQILE